MGLGLIRVGGFGRAYGFGLTLPPLILYDAKEIKTCLISKDVWVYDKMHEIQNLHE